MSIRKRKNLKRDEPEQPKYKYEKEILKKDNSETENTEQCQL